MNGHEIYFEDIVKVTTDHFGLTIDELQSRKRKRNFVNARQISIYVCREFLPWSLEQIGQKFSRDHSTVVYSFQTVKDLAQVYPAYRRELDEILFKLRLIPNDKTKDIRKDYQTENV